MRIVIVGGGIAGLAAAYFLRSHDVTVVESAEHVGGKLRTSSVAGIDVDEGAEQVIVRRPEALDLIRELGLVDELVHPRTSTAQVWARDRLRALPPRTMLGVPSSARSLRGLLPPLAVGRAALDHVIPGHAPVADVSVADYVGGRLGRDVVDLLVEPLLGGVYAGRADQLSLHATMPQLPRVGGSVMRAVAKLMPPPNRQPVFATLPGGLQRFADALATASGARLMTGRTAREIARTPNGFRLVHGATTDARELRADGVIVAVPATPASRLLADIAPAAATELQAIDYASVAIVTLALPASALPVTASSGYLVPPTAGRAVKAVTFSSAKWAHLGAADVAVVRCSFGRYGDVVDLQRDDAELVHLAAEELARTMDLHAPPIASRVSRWGGGLPQYAVGQLDRVRRTRAAVAGVPGLAVCGAAYDGVGIPACIGSARLAAEQLLTTP